MSRNFPYGFKTRARRGRAPPQRRGLPLSSPRLAAPGGALRAADGSEKSSARLKDMPPAGALRLRDGWGAVRGCRRIRGERCGLPSRPPSTQAEPSSRGPGRQGRTYSGALHLDALNHARSTVCGSKADGKGAGVSGGSGKGGGSLPVRSKICRGVPVYNTVFLLRAPLGLAGVLVLLSS